MFSSSEMIEALRRRRRRSLRLECPPGEFPPGWSAWFAAMPARAGAITGASTDSLLAVFLAREPRLPPAALAELGRWRAFASLWRQEWQPAAREDRGVRVFASTASLLLHVVLAVLLVWLMDARFLLVAPADAPLGDAVVQVEFIGAGTPEDSGGGAPQGELPPQPAPASAAPAAAASAPVVQPPPELPEPSLATREPTPPQPPAPMSAQPLQVTETPVPDSRFVLPPTRQFTVPEPVLAVPELSARQREIELVELPSSPPVQRPLPLREIAVPDLRQPPAEVVLREIPPPLPPLPSRPVPQPRLSVPELSAPAPQVATREIPLTGQVPSASSPAGDAVRAAAERAGTGSTAAAPAAAAGRPDSDSGRRADATTAGAGAGPATTPRAGALPGRAGADPGDSTRSRPGGQVSGGRPGLFNPDGSPRLAGDGRVGGGLPPGTITEDYEKIDRMGTWLKRPPIGYEPTSLDRFWVPHETLLQEWVRRNVREVMVPIPGTSKKLRCVVSLLQLGGGCGITDPNLQDVEAGARPPPAVPFKPELQEDQDALRAPPASTP
ncbi:transmembrane repetitive protein [soil metagenome]